MAYNYDKDDSGFIDDLEKSKVAVDKAARFFANQGFPVVLQPTFARPSVSEKNNFSDDGDLKLMITCEVKHRPHLSFSVESGFPYKTVIVDACHIFDKHRVKPFYYIIWNRDYSSFLFLNVNESRKRWIKSEKFDKAKNRMRNFYEVDVGLCRIVDCV
mgnify:CR=1 FL=1|tara:strand:- start:112 stop:585 length:474 start_codon:yes stop_codon:yes gene_type:complete